MGRLLCCQFRPAECVRSLLPGDLEQGWGAAAAASSQKNTISRVLSFAAFPVADCALRAAVVCTRTRGWRSTDSISGGTEGRVLPPARPVVAGTAVQLPGRPSRSTAMARNALY